MSPVHMLAKYLVLFCASQVTRAPIGLSALDNECQSGSMRLPKRVKPTHYDLELRLDVSRLQYQGRVRIDLEFDEAAAKRDVICSLSKSPPPACDQTKIVLHADRKLKIERIDFIRSKLTAGQELSECDSAKDDCNVQFCRDLSNDQLMVSLNNKFKSTGMLVMTFGGRIRTNTDHGFYRSKSIDGSNKDRPIVVTQFQSGHARTAFPCFDEPDLKATFALTIEHAKGLRAISNTPALETRSIVTNATNGTKGTRIRKRNSQRQQQLVRVRFEQTPIMSTYLLAYAVGEFDYIESRPSGSEMTIGIWTPPGRAEEARPSLEAAVKSYQLLLDYFDIEQPVKKIDLVAVGTFDGAMENWGLITFQSSQLLDSAQRRASVKPDYEHYSLNTIAHELAHHWFGNLVTMKWWDDLWLNEGFATWMAQKVTDQLFPHLAGEHYFLVHTMAPALELDADSDRTHPIKNLRLQTIEEIEESFDLITYEKASCILRMLNEHIGDEKFNRGLRSYITKNLYKNTEADDLWAALSEVSDGLDVGSLMDSWIYRAGFPLVRVSLTASNELRLSQRRFPDSGSELNWNEKSGTIWKVPISFWVSNGRNETIKMQTLLEDYDQTIALPRWFDASNLKHWLKVNANFGGFYRVLYDESVLSSLRAPVENKLLGPADRMNILSDYCKLFEVKLVSDQQFLSLFEWFENEDHELVLLTLISFLDNYSAQNIGHNPSGYLALKKYLENNPISLEPKSTSEKERENLLKIMVRDKVVFSLARFKYQPALDEAIDFYRSNKGQVTPYMQTAIFSAIAVGGTDEEFLGVLKRIKQLDEGSRRILTNYVIWALEEEPARKLIAKKHLRL